MPTLRSTSPAPRLAVRQRTALDRLMRDFVRPAPPALPPTPQLLRTPRWKRILDVALVLLAAPLWLPLMGLISVYVRCVSPGPILYRQARVGLGGRRFYCLKFRSMHVNIETQSHEGYLAGLMRGDQPMVKLDARDSRLIPGGKIFRASGLDELPQLLNILRGEMSLVGPRPCTPYEFERYEESQKGRFASLPGLTGYWQVNGKNKTTFREMIRMDDFYVLHRSPWLDLQIIARTVPVILGQVIESKLSPRHALPARAAMAERA